jgi:hypothetical protein
LAWPSRFYFFHLWTSPCSPNYYVQK